MKLENEDVVIVSNTGSRLLDDLECNIVGIANLGHNFKSFLDI
jgi:hypothetical protein